MKVSVFEFRSSMKVIDDFMGQAFDRQRLDFFTGKGPDPCVLFKYIDTDKTVSISTETIFVAFSGSHFFRCRRDEQKFVYNKEKRKATINSLKSREQRMCILLRFPEFEWLQHKDDRGYVKYNLPAEVLCDSVLSKILNGKITNAEAACRAYFKSLRIGNVDYKAYVALRNCAYASNSFSLLWMKEAFTDLNGGMRLMEKVGGQLGCILPDMVRQACALGRKINPQWSEKRFIAEHTKWTREIMGAEIKAKEQTPLYDGKTVFPTYGARVLGSEREVFEEGSEMHHCIYTNYFREIKAGNYLAIRFDTGNFRATVGLRIRNAVIKFDQAFGICDSSLSAADAQKVQTFLGNDGVRKRLQDLTGARVEDDIARQAELWFKWGFGRQRGFAGHAAVNPGEDLPF